jgi:endonuclease YncB( thermonuclease family)
MSIRKQQEVLKKATVDDVQFFRLDGYSTYCKVGSVYDGDTCTLIFYINTKNITCIEPVKYRCRLAHIDCAEKNSSDVEEVVWANRAITRFNQLVESSEMGELIYASFRSFDKYGRLLVELYPSRQDGSKSINETLVDEGLAYSYNGGRRRPFQEWIVDAKEKCVDAHPKTIEPTEEPGRIRRWFKWMCCCR